MSILSIAIAVLLIVRHHKNMRRIFAGTEPKVPLRRCRGTTSTITSRPSGWIQPLLLIGLTAAAVSLVRRPPGAVATSRAPIEVTAGPWTLRETHRELTGQQRSTRVLFAEHGRKLAVMCPRYNKVLLYDVTLRPDLEPAAEIALEGRPVAMATAGDRLVVLERPPGDDKHLGPGWWETFTLDGSLQALASRPATIPTTWPSLPTAGSCSCSVPARPRETRRSPCPASMFSRLRPTAMAIASPDRPPEPGAEGRRRPALRLGLGLAGPGHPAQGQAGRGDRPDRPGRLRALRAGPSFPGGRPLRLALRRRRLDHHADGPGIRGRCNPAVASSVDDSSGPPPSATSSTRSPRNPPSNSPRPVPSNPRPVPAQGPAQPGRHPPQRPLLLCRAGSARRRHQAGHRPPGLDPIPPRNRTRATEGSHRHNCGIDETLSRSASLCLGWARSPRGRPTLGFG